MPGHRETTEPESVERRAIERELVAQLSPDTKTQQRNRHKADQLRQLKDRLEKRKREK